MTFGLALSGGGFRASLFHLGSLARLAEVVSSPQVPYVVVLGVKLGNAHDNN